MKLTIELFNHFDCENCKYWWSMRSVQFELGQKIFCPWCNHENTITEIVTNVNLNYSDQH